MVAKSACKLVIEDAGSPESIWCFSEGASG